MCLVSIEMKAGGRGTNEMSFVAQANPADGHASAHMGITATSPTRKRSPMMTIVTRSLNGIGRYYAFSDENRPDRRISLIGGR